MASRGKAIELMRAANSELSRLKAKALFEAAISECLAWQQQGGGPEADILRAHLLSQLAVEEIVPDERSGRWLTAMTVLERRLSDPPDPPIACAYASLVVDCYQDFRSDLDRSVKASKLRSAKDWLDLAARQPISRRVRSEVLARRSSVLRHLALMSPTWDGRARALDESVRCARRAEDEWRAAPAVLELGLSEWALSRHARTDEEHAAGLVRAKLCLEAPILRRLEAAQLALPRFYRMTFRPFDACAAFCRTTDAVKSYRRILRESHVYAEAAVQLAYRDYAKEVLDFHLLESAIAAGYVDARLIVDLAHTMAIIEGPSAAKTVLREIAAGRPEVSWDAAIRVAMQASPQDLLGLGFAIGIDQAPIWTRLGTIAWDILCDSDLAEALYRHAVKIDPRDVVALTNLARFCVREGGETQLEEAKRLLQRAQNFADRRFVWWRAVQAELSERVPGTRRERPARIRRGGFRPGAPSECANVRELLDLFLQAEQLSSAEARGYALEQIIYRLADITFPFAKPSYRLRRATATAATQVDAFFGSEGGYYRVECRWRTKRAGRDDIVSFADKLDVAGVQGLFISMSGFTRTACEAAREQAKSRTILLMAGDEVRLVLRGLATFDYVLSQKQTHLAYRSEPYYVVGRVPGSA
jgi:tetratricopeptide (TPR) repeat protein